MERFHLQTTQYQYLIALIWVAFCTDIICFSEYAYVRCFLIPTKSVELHAKKSRLRLLFVLFNTKEMFSDIIQMVAGIKLQEYIKYFEPGVANSNARLLSQFSVIYGAMSMCVFMHTTMHSYIEMVEVHPYNASDSLLKILKGWKYFSIAAIFLFMITYISPQLEVDEFYSQNKLKKRDFRFVEWKQILEGGMSWTGSHRTQCNNINPEYDECHDYASVDEEFDDEEFDDCKKTIRLEQCRRQLEIPCRCVKKQCYSLDCNNFEKDYLRRIECVSERRNKNFHDCGMVYTAPTSDDNLTLNKWGGPHTFNVTGGFFAIGNISFYNPYRIYNSENIAGYVFRHKMCRFCSVRTFNSLKNEIDIRISGYANTSSVRAKCIHQNHESYTQGALTYTGEFHGFQDKSVCGRILNTQYVGSDLAGTTFSIQRLWSNILILSAGYLIVFYTLSSCAMQIWVCLPYKYQYKYFCCCKELCGCCKECRKIEQGNQIQQFSRRRSSIAQNKSFITIIVPPNSSGKNILVNNIVVRVPETAKAGDRITLAVSSKNRRVEL